MTIRKENVTDYPHILEYVKYPRIPTPTIIDNYAKKYPNNMKEEVEKVSTSKSQAQKQFDNKKGKSSEKKHDCKRLNSSICDCPEYHSHVSQEHNLLLIDKSQEYNLLLGDNLLIDKSQEYNLLLGDKLIDKSQEYNLLLGDNLIDKSQEYNLLLGDKLIDKSQEYNLLLGDNSNDAQHQELYNLSNDAQHQELYNIITISQPETPNDIIATSLALIDIGALHGSYGGTWLLAHNLRQVTHEHNLLVCSPINNTCTP